MLLDMATKAELEAQIASLEATIREQGRTLAALSSASAMEVRLPWKGYGGNRGSAPLIKSKGFDDVWLQKVLPLVVKAILKHGTLSTIHGCSHKSETDLNDSIYASGDRYIIPAIAGEILLELLNAAAEFGRLCYSDGVREGSNILKQLADGKITEENYEDRVAREKAIDTQDHKRYRAKMTEEE